MRKIKGVKKEFQIAISTLYGYIHIYHISIKSKIFVGVIAQLSRSIDPNLKKKENQRPKLPNTPPRISLHSLSLCKKNY